MKDKLLTIKDLKISFRSENEWNQAVKGIDFELYKGETLGIVGESGSGKSVTSLSLMGLLPKENSKIEGQLLLNIDGVQKELNACSEDEFRQIRGNNIAMIFQEPMTALNPVMRCGFQVDEALMLHRKMSKSEAKKATLSLFEKVKLPNVERIYNAYPHELSGGQKQRVMIAMALSCQPDILIADEPTTALDVTVQKAILDLMLDLKNEMGTSVVFITHDLGVIADIADRVIVMYKGEIVEQGTVQDIFKHPKHPYTKGLLACRPPLDFRVSHLPTVSDFMDVQKLENGQTQIIEKIKDAAFAKSFIISEETQLIRQEKIDAAPKLLEIKGLTKSFITKKSIFGKPLESVDAVSNVSFHVNKGETLGLVGESGCGKTTLSRTILRLTEPTSGAIIYNNQDITKLESNALRQLRKDIQIIFQDPYSSLNPKMTIGDAILEPMKVHKLYENDKIRKERVINLLETVSLQGDHFQRFPHEFSGGQRQRIVIARALALNPKFIICDECVSALDVSVQAQVLNLLMDLRSQFDLTYIFISHDLSVVKHISDRIMVMNKGKIEEIGYANDIYHNPSSDYTKRLIAAIPKGI